MLLLSPFPPRDWGDVNIKERGRVASLFLHTDLFSVYLSATNGNRVSETVKIKVAKPTGGLKHIGRYSMPVIGMSQGAISKSDHETESGRETDLFSVLFLFLLEV